MAPTSGLHAAREFVEEYAKAKGLLGTDPQQFKNLLNAASYVVRSEISTQKKWTFSRFRETLTAAVTANSGTTAVLVPSQKWAGELALVQLTPTAEKGPLTYEDPATFEDLVARTTPGDTKSKIYTIYNAVEIWAWPAFATGDTVQLAGFPDYMDATVELPMRFSAVAACIMLFYIGAPPPNDRTTWMDAARKQFEKLKEFDQPSSRGTNFTIPFEEASFVFDNQ